MFLLQDFLIGVSLEQELSENPSELFGESPCYNADAKNIIDITAYGCI